MIANLGNNERRPLRILPWWTAVIGLTAVAVSIAVTTLWLLSIAGRSPSLRIEAIKIGLSVGAGTGGAFALLLAFRRQSLTERTQAHAEDIARDSTFDATQRRVTELYSSAVEQLGHDKPAVRLGGLYSLERLAQDQREHRQTVVDVVCAYLRMPFQAYIEASPRRRESAPDPDANGDSSNTPQYSPGDLSQIRQELQVRLAAQRLLARHLVLDIPENSLDESAVLPETHWQGIQIDLRGASLVALDFSRCHLYQADFRDAHFSGETMFNNAYFSEVAHFDDAQFTEDTTFTGAQFARAAHYCGAQFGNTVRFNGSHFSGKALFLGVLFSGEALFFDARFDREAIFGNARFGKVATFDKTHFARVAAFDDAQFGEDAYFGDMQFDEDAFFGNVQFSGEAAFGKCAIDTFGASRFNGDAWFDKCRFSGDATFNGVDFGKDARFPEAQFSRGLTFSEATVSCLNRTHIWPPGWQVEPSSSAFKGRLVTIAPAVGGQRTMEDADGR